MGTLAQMRLDQQHDRSKTEVVLEMLESGKWIPGPEFCRPDTGGTDGLRRVRKLRAQGHQIEKRRQMVNGSPTYTWEYRLVTS